MEFSRRTLLGTGAAAGLAPGAQGPGAPPPNIVFLISDDHTAADMGCYGNSHIRTPHLDRLAREGVRFSSCFVASPQCSPNRSALFTGCTPHTTSTSRLHTPMPPWEPSFLEQLKARGYHTGAFRKVHQGDAFNGRFDFYTADRKAHFAAFFDQRPADKPFFLHVGFTDPHRPYVKGAVTPPHDPAKVRVPRFLPDSPEVRGDLALYYDFISRMDAECGEILALLQARGLAGNTVVFFTGDNGMPFPGAKGTCYDPGLHVPLIVKWPGVTKPGTVDSHLISHVDLPATWVEIAGGTVTGKMQGLSFVSLLRDRPLRETAVRDGSVRSSPVSEAPLSASPLRGNPYAAREAVFAERNWHDNFDPVRAVRTERYKLIFNAAPHFPYRPAWDLEGSPSWSSYRELGKRGALSPHHLRLLQPSRPLVEMYDLIADPDEFSNIADDPAHAAEKQILLKLLSRWMHQTYDYLPPAFAGPGEPKGRGWPVSL